MNKRTDEVLIKTHGPAGQPGSQLSQVSIPSAAAIIPSVEPTFVRIDIAGPGFIVDARGYVLTNQHDAKLFIQNTIGK